MCAAISTLPFEAGIDLDCYDQRATHLMPVPSSVEMQAGRLPLTGKFQCGDKNYADDRLRAGIARTIKRLAGRTILTLPLELAADETTATLVIQCESSGDAIPSVGENESYTLEVTDKQARLLAPHSRRGATRFRNSACSCWRAIGMATTFRASKFEISPVSRGVVYSSMWAVTMNRWKFSSAISMRGGGQAQCTSLAPDRGPGLSVESKVSEASLMGSDGLYYHSGSGA